MNFYFSDIFFQPSCCFGFFCIFAVSSGGPADFRMAVWYRPLFPSLSNYSTPHAHERTECFGSLPVVRRSTWREPTQGERVATPLTEDVGMDEMTD
ncbi:uncharacterized protein TNCV_428931 [Trichonephila clavipes]|nr:uncharacterized protein TNCV_428931 [Trichonephila clavipes]